MADEYDPLRPNDYEDFVKKRKEQRHKEREEDMRKRDMDEDRHPRLNMMVGKEYSGTKWEIGYMYNKRKSGNGP